MTELTNLPVYKLIKRLTDKGVVLDFVILLNETEQSGLLQHKDAAITAMKIISEQQSYFAIHWDETLPVAVPYSTEQFFTMPKDGFWLRKSHSAFLLNEVAEYAEYAYSFLEPPHGNSCLISDWEELNIALFSSPENLEIYRWSTDWSNYFEAGLEWWGAFYWTVYDRLSNFFVVIGGSTTD